jgi:hypothetical protein
MNNRTLVRALQKQKNQYLSKIIFSVLFADLSLHFLVYSSFANNIAKAAKVIRKKKQNFSAENFEDKLN